MFGPDGQENIPHREWIAAFDQVMKEVRATMQEQGREDEFFGAKVSHQSAQALTADIESITDHLQHSSLHFTRRIGMVYKRLYRTISGISSPYRWLRSRRTRKSFKPVETLSCSLTQIPREMRAARYRHPVRFSCWGNLR